MSDIVFDDMLEDEPEELNNPMNPTNEEIRIKIADSLGYAINGLHPKHGGMVATNIPNYPESLDACSQFEATLTDEEWEEYSDHLSDAAGVDSWSILAGKDRGALISAKPLHRCLAYLKTKGLITP